VGTQFRRGLLIFHPQRHTTACQPPQKAQHGVSCYDLQGLAAGAFDWIVRMSHNPAEWLAQQQAIKQAKEAEDPTPQPPSEPKLLGGATDADLALVRSLLPGCAFYKSNNRNNQEKVEYVWRTGFAPDRSMLSRLGYGFTVAAEGLFTLGLLSFRRVFRRRNAKHYAKHVIYTLTTSALYVIFDEEPSAPVHTRWRALRSCRGS